MRSCIVCGKPIPEEKDRAKADCADAIASLIFDT